MNWKSFPSTNSAWRVQIEVMNFDEFELHLKGRGKIRLAVVPIGPKDVYFPIFYSIFFSNIFIFQRTDASTHAVLSVDLGCIDFFRKNEMHSLGGLEKQNNKIVKKNSSDE